MKVRPSAMRCAALLYNPASGRRSAKRTRELHEAARVFHDAGVETSMIAVEPGHPFGGHAHAAIVAGCDTVVACGGDGTIHGVLQGIVGAPQKIRLGVIPMGTGNVLARNINLPTNPAKAARALLAAEPIEVAVGQVAFTKHAAKPLGESRYFILNAGVGLDGMGIYRASRESKAALGLLAYYATGLRLLASYAFPKFAAQLDGRHEIVSQVGAFRVADLGPLVGKLTPDASLHRDDLQAIVFTTSRRLDYFHYSLRSALALNHHVEGVELVHCREIACSALADSASKKIHAQADGEHLGGLPVRISMAGAKVSLLVPNA